MSGKLAVTVIWCMVAALLLKFTSAWGALPDRVAVHFGMSMQPNGWSSKSSLAVIALAAVIGQAALGTWLVLRLGTLGSFFPWTQVLTSAVLVCAFWQVITYNANKTPFHAFWVFGPMVVLFASLAVFFGDLMLRMSKK